MEELREEVLIAEEKQAWKDKVLRVKMMCMFDMNIDPLSDPKKLNQRTKDKLLKAVEKMMKKTDEEIFVEFNEWCCDEYFKKSVEELPVKTVLPAGLPPDMEE
jgi:predicted nucleic acid-binding OB-fold protein